MSSQIEPRPPAGTTHQTRYRSLVFNVAHDPDTGTIHATHPELPAVQVTATTLEELADELARALAGHLHHRPPTDT